VTSTSRTFSKEFAACTIIAKNYLPMARVLAESWHKFHPGCPIYVLFLDSPLGFVSVEAEHFQPVFTSELEIPNLAGFLFKYTVLEASTAVKPFLLNYLFERYDIGKLLYIDPDILILNSLAPLRDYLDEANILLTPHLLSPIPADERRLTEHDILKSGVYNLGFLGLRNGLESKRLLRWWSDKLYHHCIVDIEQNLFVDQRWMDLVPGLFDGVRILREPGYNVAYWNLHERSVSLEDGITVNGDHPLRFLHFSGFDADKPWVVSKHQNRFGMADIGELRELYLRYRDLLVEHGWNDAKRWTYSHDFFGNGVKITPAARRYYWSLGTNVVSLGNPFSWLENGSATSAIEKFDYSKPSRFPGGVNLIGHYQAETGVGEGARSNLRIIEAADIPCLVNNFVDPRSYNLESLPGNVTESNPFVTNLLTVNADEFPTYVSKHRQQMVGHFNIGYWAWEVPEFPEEWTPSFGYVDEVWTPSTFTRDAVAARSPVPVTVVPHSIDAGFGDEHTVDRAKFDLRPDTFVFLFFFDFDSYLDRKNPLGLIKAYKKAFGSRKDVELIIKSIHGAGHADELSLVQMACIGSNIRVMDCNLTREDKHELMRAADCYVSLHRSEGFGLTLAEAMTCGKPVIATGYSGNLDFMSDEDSFLVPYRLTTIERASGPYKVGFHWADPDLDYAADAMRQVERQRESAARIGLKARAKVRELLQPATIARSVRGRLEKLGLLGKSMPSIPGGSVVHR
jgi:glycosyltransferase involved in cell wall biosynthesis